MSAWPPKADIGSVSQEVRFVPEAHIGFVLSPSEKSGLFLHLISLFCSD